MKQNSWLNTRTNQQYGTNTWLGSPRGWIQRAVGLKTPDLALHETTTDPNLFTVAGIWRRGQPVPDSGSLPAFYRFFSISENIRKYYHAGINHYPVIGMAWVVPEKDILKTYNYFRSQGAEWLWWDWPVESKPKKYSQGKMLDHADLYERFESGQTVSQVADALDLLRPSVHYVYKKWQAGHSSERRAKVPVDHEMIVQDLRMGRKVADMVQDYGCSRTMIYKIKGKYRIK